MANADGHGLKPGDRYRVVAGSHAGKSGMASDFNTSKTGHVTITVTQDSGVRFKTLLRNVVPAHAHP